MEYFLDDQLLQSSPQFIFFVQAGLEHVWVLHLHLSHLADALIQRDLLSLTEKWLVKYFLLHRGH
jgi:hypothetical protein